MNINDYIVTQIKPLSLSSTVKSALKVCENYPISHIPVIENGLLIGCFAESDIRTIENLNRELREYLYVLQHFSTDEKATLLELLSLFADNDCNLIPVLDKNKKYIGYYDLADVLDVFADSPFLHRDNENLVVEKVKTDFSMSQVAQIVESNGAKLLGMYISAENVDTIQITLKIASEEMNEIIQTFRRYDYHVITQHVDDEYLEELRERADYFNRYLNI